MLKFQPSKSEKILISIRIDENLLQLVDRIASNSDISRNELIIQSIKFAIEHTEYANENKKVVNN